MQLYIWSCQPMADGETTWHNFWTPWITNQQVSACFSQAFDVTSLSVPTYWEERGQEI